MTQALRILVVTIVHRPLDARIHARQIRAMREAGWDVTYAAPWSDTDTPHDPDLATVDLPRAVGRRRLHAVQAARRMLRARARAYDLVLLHDPELLMSVAGLRDLPPVVWDVHEDVAASLVDRGWVPNWLRPVLQSAAHVVERWAEHRHHVILAETSYAARFRKSHPVVRNLPWVPRTVAPSGPGRAVYLGRISRSRGLDTLLAVADLVAPHVMVELIGYADPDVEEDVRQAHDEGRLRWHGFVSNAEAVELVEGATAGLSLLRDEPNFRGSLPTKVAEYMAHGVPVITTPLPEALDLLRTGTQAGSVVPFGDAPAAAQAILLYHYDEELRLRAGTGGHAIGSELANWHYEAGKFLDSLADLVR